MTQKPESMKAPREEKAKQSVARAVKRKPKPAVRPEPKTGAASQAARRRVIFAVNAEPGSEVFVAGDFNEWNPAKHPLKDKSGAGEFERQIYAKPGPIEYKFVINGEWVIDARCPAWVPNAMGSLNSVIDVH